MTREEAVKEAHSIDNQIYSVGEPDVQDLVSKIYNDFESRTCENCNHKDYGTMGAKCAIYDDFGKNEDKFSCSFWEAKDAK